MPNFNMAFTSLGFKGAGKPNGVPAYTPNGLYTLGGVQKSTDSGVMKYGIVVNSDPAGDDGIFSTGGVSVVGVASVYTLTVTAAVTVNGNINVDGTVIAVTTAGQGTTANLALAIRSALYARWVASGATTTAIFTAKALTVYSQPVIDWGGTGGAGSIGVTTAGTVGSAPRGVVVYRPDVAMLDASKPDYILQGTPLAIAYFGTLWLSSWTKVAAGAIDPVIGCVVIAKDDTGVIEFLPAGSSAPSGYSKFANCKVVSVSTDTNGALLFVNI